MLHSNVTVIIPTTAQKSRHAEIRRCIQSIRDSSRFEVQIITVVNGASPDPGVCEWLKVQSDVRFEYIETPSAPNAVFHGRKLVTTAYFSTLDDDDEYLEGSTDLKLAVLTSSPGTDLVVTNAYRRCDGVEELLYAHLATVPINPLKSLFEANWLHNGNSLFRSSSIGAEYFADYRPFAEWTWLAFKIALDGKKVQTLDHPTFRVNVTPNSLSQSDAYFDGYLPLFKSMIELAPPKDILRLIHRRMSAAWHLNSVRALQQGNRNVALRCHLRSLFLPGGLRYLSYSRHLLQR